MDNIDTKLLDKFLKSEDYISRPDPSYFDELEANILAKTVNAQSSGAKTFSLQMHWKQVISIAAAVALLVAMYFTVQTFETSEDYLLSDSELKDYILDYSDDLEYELNLQNFEMDNIVVTSNITDDNIEKLEKYITEY